MKAITLINLCAREYQDVAFERVAKDPAGASVTNGANWLDYLNDAQRAVVLARPDAKSAVQSVQLIAGTRQSVPSGSLRILGATRNMGADGLTPGKVINMSDRTTLDGVDQDWHTATAGAVVTDLIYDDKKAPLVFFVSPPVPAAPAVYIELELSKSPTDVTDADTGDIDLSDLYAIPMQHWMLFRAYSMATQSQHQFTRANFYLGAFFNVLGIKIRNEMLVAAGVGGAFVPSPTNLGVVRG